MGTRIVTAYPGQDVSGDSVHLREPVKDILSKMMAGYPLAGYRSIQPYPYGVWMLNVQKPARSTRPFILEPADGKRSEEQTS